MTYIKNICIYWFADAFPLFFVPVFFSDLTKVVFIVEWFSLVLGCPKYLERGLAG